jgi:nitrate/nitrite transporter NarK
MAATTALVVIGIAGASYGMLMAHARAFFPRHLTGRGVTLMNFFAIGGVGLMQFATGGVVSAAASPQQPAAAYVALFAFYALTLGGAFVIYLFSRDAAPGRG